MAKCRMLIQENQELGRQLSQGRIAQLEAELALQKKYSEELKSSQDGKVLVLVVAHFLPRLFSGSSFLFTSFVIYSGFFLKGPDDSSRGELDSSIQAVSKLS